MTIRKPNLDSSLKRRIYDTMLDGIIRGEYQPDTPFTEKELVDKFQVSKSPIREALIELCNEGALRSIPRFGYEVIRITDRDVEEIKKFRLLIECGSMDRDWGMISTAHIQSLQNLLEQDYGVPGNFDVHEHWKRNTKFHLQLISCYNNEYLYNSLADALRFLARAYGQFFWDKWRQTVYVGFAEGHKELLEVIRSRDKKNALKLLEKDICGFAESRKPDLQSGAHLPL
ncbi:GntR family transcriptional regulator [Treponema sp. OttesenSCG-928-L16]|nr:GntR family transcriptional regulator [Treponema sp. OttesenSCG-928-L16]